MFEYYAGRYATLRTPSINVARERHLSVKKHDFFSPIPRGMQPRSLETCIIKRDICARGRILKESFLPTDDNT